MNLSVRLLAVVALFAVVSCQSSDKRGKRVVGLGQLVEAAESPITPQLRLAIEAGSDPKLGQGYDTLNGSLKGFGIDDSALSESGSDAAGLTRFKLQIVEDSSSLATEMNVEASASFAGLWGGGSASSSYARSRSETQYKLYMLASVEVITGFKRLDRYLLAKEASDQLRKQGAGTFFGTYGDQFVSGIAYGGEMYGVIELECTSLEDKQQLKAKLNVGIGAFSGSGSFDQTTKETISSRTSNITFFKRGEAASVPTTLETLQAEAVDFPNKVKAAPKAMYAYTQSYFAASNRPTQVNPPELTSTRVGFTRLAKARDLALRTDRDTSYVLAHQDQFTQPVPLDLQKIQQQAADSVRRIENLVLEQAVSPLAGNSLEQTDALLAELQVDVLANQLPPWVREARIVDAEQPFVLPVTYVGEGNWRRQGGDNNVNSKGDRRTDCLLHLSTPDLQPDGRTVKINASFRVREVWHDNTHFSGTQVITQQLPLFGGTRVVSIEALRPVLYEELKPGQLREFDVPSIGSNWTDLLFFADREGDDQNIIGFSGTLTIKYKVEMP